MRLTNMVLLLCVSGGSACSWLAKAGMSDLIDTGLYRALAGASTTTPAPPPYVVLPGQVSTGNNAFITNDLQRPIRLLSGNDKPLLENLAAYFANSTDDMCYWAFQGLPPPRRNDNPENPYDVSDGHDDQDIEWVQAYGEVAVSRLHSRIKKDGPVVGAMCSMGAVIAKQRCANGRSEKWKCIDAITNGTIQWPMAVSIWRIGHPDLHQAVEDWRASTESGHFQNINWVAHAPGSSPARPWKGPQPKPGEIDPSDMPMDEWPVSKDIGWGAPKIAKVVKCADIPKNLYYSEELHFCDSMPRNDTSAPMSAVDEAYRTWKSLGGLWPPTKPCEDNLEALNATMAKLIPQLMGADCKTVYAVLVKALPNWDCDNSDITQATGYGSFRDMCCSVCGGGPIPNVPAPSPPPAEAPYGCLLCNHVYDAQRDGNGTAFEDLPDSWRCPVCGAPKSAYLQRPTGEWEHSH